MNHKSEVVSPVCLLTSRERQSRLLRQPHPVQEVSEAGIGPHVVPERVYGQIGHATRMLLVTLFEEMP